MVAGERNRQKLYCLDVHLLRRGRKDRAADVITQPVGYYTGGCAIDRYDGGPPEQRKPPKLLANDAYNREKCTITLLNGYAYALAQCNAAMPPERLQYAGCWSPAPRRTSRSSSWDGNLRTESGRYWYAKGSPEIRAPNFGRMYRK